MFEVARTAKSCCSKRQKLLRSCREQPEQSVTEKPHILAASRRMLLTRTSLLIDRSKAERTYFLRVHVHWDWNQMCDDTSVIHNLVRLIKCHRSNYSAKKIVQIFHVLMAFPSFTVGK